jgi:hypothetical protein
MAGEWIERVRDASHKAAIERVFVIRVDAFDWNCPLHITPRFTTEELQDALAPSEQQLRQLEQENEHLQETARAGWRNRSRRRAMMSRARATTQGLRLESPATW